MDINKIFSEYKFKLTAEYVERKLKKIEARTKEKISEVKILKQIISCIDLTTLEGSDTKEKVKNLCIKAVNPIPEDNTIPSCAAVCFYPVFINYAKKILNNKNVKIATVGTAFPSGQYQESVKYFDVKQSLKDGADEIDMVISRGEFLSGNYQYVYHEIRKVKELCTEYSLKKRKDIKLKVILEVGELVTNENIWYASVLAMYAGADFIKTSTGKISVSATPESVFIMANAIKDFYKKTKKRVGIKPAGGIRTVEDAYKYYFIVKSVLGEKWLNKDYFRIGASSLLDNIVDYLNNLKV
ncbi:MAG: deoxyribose-phosphate aldolase [Ignavibacteria bacterium]|nr:deoxyribose-phosphate aldolase [Ignavibacteria bacterium]